MTVTWMDVEVLTEELASRVRASEFHPNYLVAVARGGFIPARLLSNRLGVRKMGSVGITYTDEERTERTIYDVPSNIGVDDRILLIEDALESGRSLSDCRNVLETKGAVVRSACYYYRHDCLVHPDFAVKAMAAIPQFPWE